MIIIHTVGTAGETACCSGTPYFLLNRKYVHVSVSRLSCDHYCPNRQSTGTQYCNANLSGSNIFYCYSTSTAISKGYGEQPCVPRLTSYLKAPTAFSHTQRPVTAKTYVLGKSTDSLFAYPCEPPESAIKAQHTPWLDTVLQ